jgi:hypothetical protein
MYFDCKLIDVCNITILIELFFIFIYLFLLKIYINYYIIYIFYCNLKATFYFLHWISLISINNIILLPILTIFHFNIKICSVHQIITKFFDIP